MEGPLLAWWTLLCAAAVVNVAAWAVSFARWRRGPGLADPGLRATRKAMVWLSAVYVAGCAFRSILPMVDVPRFCLHDTPLSRVFVGRSVATVAELCFALQWALLLREMSGGRGAAGAVARAVMPLIAVAEACSWAAVLLSRNLLHAIENSLWALVACLALFAFGTLHGRMGESERRFLLAAAACAGGYIGFMLVVDVPMYVARWLEAAAAPTSLAAGLASALAPCVVQHDWGAWREDALWLTLYFTLAVWISIALAHAPALKPGR